MGDNTPEVLLLSEWFAREAEQIAALNLGLEGDYILLGHCTETTNVPATPSQWQALYKACGLKLTYQPTGCCGMAGIYGHETRNQTVSRKAYELSWQSVVEKPENQGRLVATGYSCRSQAKRLSDARILHPVQMLLHRLKDK